MNKITFMCKRSGNTVSFINENDIAELRKHEGYEEIKNVETSETIQTKPDQTPVEKVLKQRGRPSKVPSFLQE